MHASYSLAPLKLGSTQFFGPQNQSFAEHQVAADGQRVRNVR